MRTLDQMYFRSNELIQHTQRFTKTENEIVINESLTTILSGITLSIWKRYMILSSITLSILKRYGVC